MLIPNVFISGAKFLATVLGLPLLKACRVKMLNLQLDLCVMSALVLIVLGRTTPSSPSVTAQIDKDTSRNPAKSKDYHINEMLLVRSKPRLDNGAFGMLFGLTCPIFLHGRFSNSQNVFKLFKLLQPNDCRI